LRVGKCLAANDALSSFFHCSRIACRIADHGSVGLLKGAVAVEGEGEGWALHYGFGEEVILGARSEA